VVQLPRRSHTVFGGGPERRLRYQKSASFETITKGGKTFLQATVRDITEQKRIESALRESEAHYRAVTRAAGDAIVTADGASNITGWNPAAERMFGYAEAEVLGQSLTQLMPPRFREQHVAGIKRVMAGGERPTQPRAQPAAVSTAVRRSAGDRTGRYINAPDAAAAAASRVSSRTNARSAAMSG